MVKDRTNAERQRRFIARLKAKARATVKPQPNDETVALQAQITTLKAQIKALKAKRETTESGEIQRLESANLKLRQERMARIHWSRDYNERGRMPYHLYVMVMKVLHSDTADQGAAGRSLQGFQGLEQDGHRPEQTPVLDIGLTRY